MTTAGTAASARRRRPAVGRRLPRVEDRPLLTGEGSFVDDLPFAGVLECAFLRSPMAHGRIVDLDLEPSRARPGVAAVVGAVDLGLPPLVSPCETPNSFSPPRPLLADGVVRFVGEAMAAVVADSRYEAEDTLDTIHLELEPLEPLPDARRALEPDAPRLHDNPDNVLLDSRIDVGDVDAAFAEAAVVVERRLRHPRSAALPLEGRGIVAVPAESGGIALWASTQGPHKLRLAVAEVLGLPMDEVRVVCPAVGGGFGLKAHVYPEEIVVAWLALQLGRPVKWIEDRSENLLSASHARDQELRVRAAADAGGRLLAVDVEQLCDQGAYGTYPHGSTLEALTTPALIPGPYRLANYRVHARSVATTKCPQGAYRGVGFVVSAFVHERIMDALARELGLDRAEIRRRNLIAANELPYTSVMNQQYDSGDYARALATALEKIGYDTFADEQQRARAEGRLLGLGLSCYVEPTGMNSRVFKGRGMVGIEGYDGAHVSLDAEGFATVWTTVPAIGQGSDTTFAQLVADALDLAVERVRVARADTGIGGLSGTGTFASRSMVSGGGAVLEACREVRRRLLDDAGERLEVDPGDLETADGRVRVVGSPRRALGYDEIVAAAPEDRYRVSAQFDPAAVAYPYATHACRVEVDPETGAVTVDRYVVAEDCGTVVNPLVVEGQTHGATAQGIASALLEEVMYDESCQLQSGSLLDFLAPTAGDVPAFELTHLETPAPSNAVGVKGAGEGGTIGAPGAVANGVADALGVDVDELPLTPERIRAALAHARGA